MVPIFLLSFLLNMGIFLPHGQATSAEEKCKEEELFFKSIGLTKKQQTIFSGENGMLNYLKARFPGTSANSEKLVQGFAALLPVSEQEAYIKKHGNLDNDNTVGQASNRPTFSKKLVELIMDWVKVQTDHGNIKETFALSDFFLEKTGQKIFGNIFVPKLSLTKGQYTTYLSNIGIDKYLKTRFPGATANIEKLVLDLAALLHLEEQEGFIAKFSNLRKSLLNDAQRLPNSAANITELLLEWANIQFRYGKINQVPSVDMMIFEQTGKELWGDVFVPKLSLTAKQHQVYSGVNGMRNYLLRRFHVVSTNSLKLVEDLATLLPKSERRDFILRHGNLGNNMALASSNIGIGSAARITELLLDWARIQFEYGGLKKIPSLRMMLLEKTGQQLFGIIFVPNISP